MTSEEIMESRQAESDLTAELGRRTAHLLKQAAPRLRRLKDEALPRLERAGRVAGDYARAHEHELRQVAAGLLRARMVGPVGTLVGNLVAPGPGERAATNSQPCHACRAVNPPRSRFCNQCGSRLQQTVSGA